MYFTQLTNNLTVYYGHYFNGFLEGLKKQIRTPYSASLCAFSLNLDLNRMDGVGKNQKPNHVFRMMSIKSNFKMNLFKNNNNFLNFKYISMKMDIVVWWQEF